MIPKHIKSLELVGKKVVTTRDIRSGAGIVIPRGTKVIIKDMGRSFSIETLPCPICGLSAYVRGITRNSVAIIEEEF